MTRTFVFATTHVFLWLLRQLPKRLLPRARVVGTTSWTERRSNNGRFAMFATMGIIAAELYTGKDAVEQWGF